MNRFLATGVLAFAFSQAAHAQQGAPAPAPAPATTKPAVVMFKAWDKSGDGQLSLVEFHAGWQQVQAVAKAKAALDHQFAVIDANRDRAIDVDEYGNLLLVKGADKAAPPLARFDANRNGKLEFIEYVRLVETLAPRQEAHKDAKS
jgi:Ca2+-binding EF-hand superfamily protein